MSRVQRMVLASLFHHLGRTTALFLGVLVATTGFTLLTGSTETARLQVTGTVSEHARGAYEILVRPAGARTALEQERGLVRPNFLVGQYGGISVAQWRQIQQMSGVEVAAPIAMLGYASTWTEVEVDITNSVDRSKTRQLIQVRPVWQADRGLTQAVDPMPGLVYVTKLPLAWPAEPVGMAGENTYIQYSDGSRRFGSTKCFKDWIMIGLPFEEQEDGRTLPVCPSTVYDRTEPRRVFSSSARLNEDGSFTTENGQLPRLRVRIRVPMPLLLAAIDPVAEAALTGLDSAIADGRYLSADETAMPYRSELYPPTFPGEMTPAALLVKEPIIDDQVLVRTQQVNLGATVVAGRVGAQIAELENLPTLPGTEWTSAAVAATDGYIPEIWDGEHSDTGFPLSTLMLRQLGPVGYDVGDDGGLRPRTTDAAAELWHEGENFEAPPMLSHDVGFRALQRLSRAEVMGNLGAPVVVGVFDRAKLRVDDEPAGVPLDAYAPVSAIAGDDRTRGLLGDAALLPSTNPAGYLVAAPSVLLALNTVVEAGGKSDPISAIRVRAAGITGFDAVSRERVRVLAETISATTGLDVDIMYGSSAAPQKVTLPGGSYGRPQLSLDEPWYRKGVAVALTEAVDRKSIVLFGLILAVCTLFVGNAVSAAVRDRRRELAILACVGWPRYRLATLIGGEVVAVTVAAGLMSVLAAWGVGRMTGIAVPISQAVLAVPVALGLAVAAATIPVWRASRAHPGSAVDPLVAAPGRRTRHRQSLMGLAVTNLLRAPGRTTPGVVALALGIAGLTIVAAVTWVFHGTATGTLLGDAVSVRVRPVDAVAVAATVLLGLVAVADVLYINVRERAAELATLRATGWSERAIGRLVTYEGAAIGVLGALLGAAAGLAGVALFAGPPPPQVLWTAVGAATAGVVLATLASLVPALLQRRVPMSITLAEE